MRDVVTETTPRSMTTCVTLFDYQAIAEEEGFEPPELALGGFQDRCLRPLGHSSRRTREARLFIEIDPGL